MKPKAIYLIRHGESIGNVDESIYETVPDWKVGLTEKGHGQARKAAAELWEDISRSKDDHHVSNVFSDGDHRVSKAMFYSSPWVRARQTAEHLNGPFGAKIYEDPRIREQEWGNFAEEQFKLKIEKERKKFGTFFYRMPYGESGADVFDRVTTFIDTLYRDFEKPDYPGASVIVSHGLTVKAFLARWFHWPVEDFDSYKTPRNCELLKMVLGQDGRYTLTTPLRRRPN